MITNAQAVEELKQILTTGLLRIRSASSLSFCQLEADHLHNIPFLIINPSRELIDSYFNVEKVAYVARLGTAEKLLAEQWYGQHWRVIEEYVLQFSMGIDDE